MLSKHYTHHTGCKDFAVGDPTFRGAAQVALQLAALLVLLIKWQARCVPLMARTAAHRTVLLGCVAAEHAVEPAVLRSPGLLCTPAGCCNSPGAVPAGSVSFTSCKGAAHSASFRHRSGPLTAGLPWSGQKKLHGPCATRDVLHMHNALCV